MVNLLKQLAVGGALIIGLYALGSVVDTYVPWIWLTYFFGLLRAVVRPLDFIWQTAALFQVMGATFSFFVGVYAFRSYLIVRDLFVKA